MSQCVYCDKNAVASVKIAEAKYNSKKELVKAAQYSPMCSEHKNAIENHMMTDKQGRLVHEKRSVRRKVLKGQTTVEDFLA